MDGRTPPLETPSARLALAAVELLGHLENVFSHDVGCTEGSLQPGDPAMWARFVDAMRGQRVEDANWWNLAGLAAAVRELQDAAPEALAAELRRMACTLEDRS